MKITTTDVVNKFNEAFNRHNISEIMSLMTNDCIFENTYPAPDGTCFVGQKEIGLFWEKFFSDSKNARFEVEEQFTSDDRCIVRWIYHWKDKFRREGHVRGVDIITVRDGKIAAKLSYVKG